MYVYIFKVYVCLLLFFIKAKAICNARQGTFFLSMLNSGMLFQ